MNGTRPSSAPAKVIRDFWLNAEVSPGAGPLRWAEQLVETLAEAGFTLVGPDTWTCPTCGVVRHSSAEYGEHLLARTVNGSFCTPRQKGSTS